MVEQTVKQMVDARNRLDEALLKAKSLSLITYGEPSNGFHNLDEEHQDVILWILSDFIYAADAAKDALYRAMEGGGDE